MTLNRRRKQQRMEPLPINRYQPNHHEPKQLEAYVASIETHTVGKSR